MTSLPREAHITITLRRVRRGGCRPARLDAPCALLAMALTLTTHATLGAHGDLHQQIAAATRAIGARPHDAALYLARGELYRDHHDTTGALADYATALRMDPSLDAVRLARGRLLVEARRASEALPDLDRFLAAHAGHAEALVVRARARASTGDAPGAREDYDGALRLAPNPDWFIDRARLVRESAGPNAAIEGLDEGLARLGPIVTLTLEAIEYELALDRHDAALVRLDRLISVSGPHPQWMVQRGDILAAAGRTADARQAFTAALSAIDALPASRQRTRQIQALRARCTAALSALDTPARIS